MLVKKTTKAAKTENEQYHMEYYMSGDENGAPSWLTVEWTQLLGCGVDEDGERIHNCDIVIQSICQDDFEGTDAVNSNGQPAKTADDLQDVYTIRNGAKYETIDFEEDVPKILDPKGGCFVDSHDRDLPHHLTTNIPNNVESAVDFCVDSCKDAGFAYAGLQFRTHCFCGNSFGKHGQVALNECNMNCPGEKNEKCGSGWRNNVYLTGLLEPSDEDESKAEKDQRKAKSAAHRHGIHESWEAYDR